MTDDEAPEATHVPAEPDTFDRSADGWLEYLETPWAKMRYSVAWHVLRRHLPQPGISWRVLDVGGGDGKEALRLAELGHRVTIVDYSRTMLQRAESAARTAGLSESVTCVELAVEELSRLDIGPFDLVLCHFVLGYVASPDVVVSQLAACVRDDGLVSVIAANPAGRVLSAAVRELDFSGAAEQLAATRHHAVAFGHDVAKISIADGERLIADAGLTLVHRYGGRMIVDLVADADLKSDPKGFAAMEALEHRLCDLSPYRDIGAFWQVIARRVA